MIRKYIWGRKNVPEKKEEVSVPAHPTNITELKQEHIKSGNTS
jgi:hypothetical protein